MEGYLVTFFTQHNREHGGMPVATWIIEEAKKLGVRGATLFSGKEGFGHDGRFHSDNYFDLEDPPVQVAMAPDLRGVRQALGPFRRKRVARVLHQIADRVRLHLGVLRSRPFRLFPLVVDFTRHHPELPQHQVPGAPQWCALPDRRIILPNRL